MKKQILISLISLSSILTMNAQWDGTTTLSNVGIGITTPETKFQIDGNGGVPINSYSDLTARANFILSSTTAGGLGTQTKLLGGIGSQDYVWLQAYNSYGSGVAKNIVLNSVGGFVGIGTNCPKYTLDVLGVIRAQEVKVDLQGGCDFVFKTDYKLMDLKELEKFVKTNQHLPEIASEKEMIENGLNLKEFQMKLLQKVEELTLYVIEQDKQLKQQNKKIEKQNQEIKKLKEIKKRN
jgi:hypothetical protein